MLGPQLHTAPHDASLKIQPDVPYIHIFVRLMFVLLSFHIRPCMLSTQGKVRGLSEQLVKSACIAPLSLKTQRRPA
jgi:hypothetical protein